MTAIDPDILVRGTESPAVTCPYCNRPFDTQRSQALHLGEEHADQLTDTEQDAYYTAIEDEQAELWWYHMKVVVALGVTNGVVILGYMVVLA